MGVWSLIYALCIYSFQAEFRGSARRTSAPLDGCCRLPAHASELLHHLCVNMLPTPSACIRLRWVTNFLKFEESTWPFLMMLRDLWVWKEFVQPPAFIFFFLEYFIPCDSQSRKVFGSSLITCGPHIMKVSWEPAARGRVLFLTFIHAQRKIPSEISALTFVFRQRLVGRSVHVSLRWIIGWFSYRRMNCDGD